MGRKSIVQELGFPRTSAKKTEKRWTLNTWGKIEVFSFSSELVGRTRSAGCVTLAIFENSHLLNNDKIGLVLCACVNISDDKRLESDSLSNIQ